MSASLRVLPATLSALRSKRTRVVVVGPSGWLGSAALAMLDAAFAGDELARHVDVFGSHARPLALPSGRSLACRDIAALPRADLTDALVLHFGYLTKDKIASMSVDDYVAANDAIQAHVLQAVATSGPAGLFFASSGGVYQGREPGRPTKEENLYGWMKLRHEAEFAAAAERSGVALINGRIFSIAGEYINKVELYALGSFLTALKDERPIQLSASREVWRSYTYVGDVINFALTLLLKRQSCALDIAGDTAIEVGALARLCAEVAGRPDATIARPPLTGAPADRMLGDCGEYYRLMAREGIQPLALEGQIGATASYLGIH